MLERNHLLEQEGIRFSLSGSLGNLSLEIISGRAQLTGDKVLTAEGVLAFAACCLGHAQGSWLWRTTQPISGAKCYSVLSKPGTALEAQRTCAGVCAQIYRQLDSVSTACAQRCALSHPRNLRIVTYSDATHLVDIWEGAVPESASASPA